MADILREIIKDPSAWTPADLADDKSWDLELARSDVDDLIAGAAATKQAGLTLGEINQSNFPLKRSSHVLDAIAGELRTGRGFALLHGFPVEGHTLEDVERMYWGFCAHLGIGLTQNSDGTLIHYVTEGRLRPNQGTRSVGNPGRVTLHVDLADVVSLLCVRQPEDSPPSRLSSTTALHNALQIDHPEMLDRLYEGFVWDRQGEHATEETPTTGYPVPFFSQENGQVSCRYNRTWMRKAAERGGKGFSAEDAAILDAVDEITHANAFEFPFETGDVQFANNYVMLHGRAPHAPAQTEETTRLLMRLWFNMDDIRDFTDDAIIRHGIIRHGRLGWTAEQLANGPDGQLHARRSDGAPA
jgi:hypothetical protein